MPATYDFIIVGGTLAVFELLKSSLIIIVGGTAGCLLAHRLSHASARPSVLLVEAGSSPEGVELRAPFFRYAAPALRPDLDYGYESTPQKQLNNRTIPYTRGKGLGGSSVLNFQVYLNGSAEDYNRWAELVGDDSWKWEHTKKSFQEIEDFDFSGASAYPQLAKPDPTDHGTDGAVKVCLPPVLEKGMAPALEAVTLSGEKVNLDFNSGDPVGVGIFPSSVSKDGRTTSATAHLLNAPDNLSIWTDAIVQRLQFDGAKVLGIETVDGRKGQSMKPCTSHVLTIVSDVQQRSYCLRRRN
jgi:choline dehydrogenase-like flavoprotein